MATDTTVARQRPGGPEEKWVVLALDCVRRIGFSNLTLGRLAQELGVSKPSLNYQFGSLDQLFATLVDRFFRQDEELLTEVFRDSSEVSQSLRLMLQRFLSEDNTLLVRLEMLLLSARNASFLESVSAHGGKLLHGHYRELVLRDGCPAGQLDATLDMILSVANGAALQFALERDMEKIDALLAVFSEAYDALRQSWTMTEPS